MKEVWQKMKAVWQKTKAFRLNARSYKSCPTLEHLYQFADRYVPPYVPEKQEIHLPDYPSPLNITPTSHQRKNADFLLLPFTSIEFNKIIQSKKNTTPGPDNISYPLLRQLPLQTNSILLNILIVCGSIQSFPQNGYMSKLHQSPKKSPIALMSCIRKIESIICTRMTHWMEQNSLIPRISSDFDTNRALLTA